MRSTSSRVTICASNTIQKSQNRLAWNRCSTRLKNVRSSECVTTRPKTECFNSSIQSDIASPDVTIPQASRIARNRAWGRTYVSKSILFVFDITDLICSSLSFTFFWTHNVRLVKDVTFSTPVRWAIPRAVTESKKVSRAIQCVAELHADSGVPPPSNPWRKILPSAWSNTWQVTALTQNLYCVVSASVNCGVASIVERCDVTPGDDADFAADVSQCSDTCCQQRKGLRRVDLVHGHVHWARSFKRRLRRFHPALVCCLRAESPTNPTFRPVGTIVGFMRRSTF